MKAALTGAVVAAVLLPALAFAQAYYPSYAQLQITTQTQTGAAWPPAPVLVEVFAPNVSVAGSGRDASNAEYEAQFRGDSQTAIFSPGQYEVSALQAPGYVFSYSPGCSGTALAGSSYFCTITASRSGSAILNSGQGQLIVYTQVNSYALGGALPAGAFLSVSGNTPSQTAIPLASSGANTAAITFSPGAFAVTAPQFSGWQVTEQGNCQGTIGGGQTLSCTVTYSYGIGNGSTLYPYNPTITAGPLSCSPSYQQAAAGSSARFTATGGAGVYNWTTPERNYIGIGPVLNAVFLGTGLQTVVVSSGAQIATCRVNVVPESSVAAQTQISNSTLTPTLPNTGFAPNGWKLIAASLAAALALALIIAFYGRRALLALF